MNRLLLVEDDRAVAIGIEYSLKKEGFSVTHKNNLESARESLKEEEFDLVLLDITLPDGDGYDFCFEIRENKNDIPIIFITACDEECNVVLGLDLGGDDYVTKPIRVRELVSRINAVLRRRGKVMAKANNILKSGDIKIDVLAHSVFKDDNEVELTKGEFKLLNMFLENKNQVLERNVILEKLWDIDGEFVDANTLNVYIKRLREKIEDDIKKPEYIKTIRGVGYRWDKEVE